MFLDDNQLFQEYNFLGKDCIYFELIYSVLTYYYELSVPNINEKKVN